MGKGGFNTILSFIAESKVLVYILAQPATANLHTKYQNLANRLIICDDLSHAQK